MLSGNFDHQLQFDSGFQTCPIVPFDEPVKNAWDDQKVDFENERRRVQPMPPISSITISHLEWIRHYEEKVISFVFIYRTDKLIDHYQ